MELKETCKITLDKGTQKVKCYKFFQTDFERELAIHQSIDHKAITNITDVKSGMMVCKINKEVSKVTDKDVNEAVDNFIKHFTLEEILKRFKELDEIK